MFSHNELLIFLLVIWIFFSWAIFWVENYLFYRLLKQSGVSVSFLVHSTFGYTRYKYHKWKNVIDLSMITPNRLKVRKVILINALLSLIGFASIFFIE